MQSALHNKYIEDNLEYPELEDVCVLMEDNEKPGVRVGTIGKQFMIMSLEEKLNTQCLRFNNYVVTVGKDLLGVQSDPEQRKKDLITQLASFMWVESTSTSLQSKVKRTATGKIGGNQDDICMAVLHSRICEKIFNSTHGKKRYKEWHNRIKT